MAMGRAAGDMTRVPEILKKNLPMNSSAAALATSMANKHTATCRKGAPSYINKSWRAALHSTDAAPGAWR